MKFYKSVIILVIVIAQVTIIQCEKSETIDYSSKIKNRNYPSIFQAWYPIDMKEYPMSTKQQLLEATAKHDLIWEEPLSQLGEGQELALGPIWNNKHNGLATNFTKASLNIALENKKVLQKLNPSILAFMEVRWRDAPASFLPSNSNMWMRDSLGNLMVGWKGGSEPFYMLNYKNEAFQNNVARQAKTATESGVYDGIILDWGGQLEIVKKVREAIGPNKLIIVNIHDDIEIGKKYKDYINGAFMELNPIDYSPNKFNNQRDWDRVRESLIWFENNLQQPRINCLEVWGERNDLARMRAVTTLGMIYSDGYQLFSDYNQLKTPDHLHNWYSFWDVNLGLPLGKYEERNDGAAIRNFKNGIVVYNHYEHNPIILEFDKPMLRVSTNEVDTKFSMKDRDGDIFLYTNENFFD